MAGTFDVDPRKGGRIAWRKDSALLVVDRVGDPIGPQELSGALTSQGIDMANKLSDRLRDVYYVVQGLVEVPYAKTAQE